MRYLIKESGRSMLEMIAVLFVLAVVSVVGLVGYDFAKERFWAVNASQAILKMRSISRVQGRNVTDTSTRINLPDGLLMVSVDYTTRTATIYYDEDEVDDKKFDALMTYGYEVGNKTDVEYVQGDIKTTYPTRTLRFKGDVPVDTEVDTEEE